MNKRVCTKVFTIEVEGTMNDIRSEKVFVGYRQKRND